MDMYKHIWDDCDLFVHGASLKETQPKKNVNTWEDKSHKFIAPPPPHTHTLASRYPKITAIPIQQRLCRSTKELAQWLARVKHQASATGYGFHC